MEIEKVFKFFSNPKNLKKITPDSLCFNIITPDPIKMSKVAEGPEIRVPWVGEHTNQVLTEELALSVTELEDLRKMGIISQ